MRRRIIRSTTAIALLCVTALGVPLVLLARHQVFSNAQGRVRGDAAEVAAAVEDPIDAGQQIDLRRFAASLPGRRIVVSAGAMTVSAGPTVHGEVITGVATFAGGRVSVVQPAGAATASADTVTLVVGLLAALAIVAAVAMAEWQGRRLAAPLAMLADAARRAGPSQVLEVEPSGVPEIDDLAAALAQSTHATVAVVERQRDFASDAAHQLRTPLTGIGLHLDEVRAIGDRRTRAEAEAAQVQVDRLEATITALLARARGDVADAVATDLAALVAATVDPWRAVLAAAGRPVELEIASRPTVLAHPHHVTSVLDALLDNACTHGRGAVAVRVDRRAGLASVHVSDDGPGVPPEVRGKIFERRFSAGGGTGIGLALAAALAGGEGGTLVLQNRATFRLDLPLAGQ